MEKSEDNIMTEEQKALAGYLYDAQEESLGIERKRSQELNFDYNILLSWRAITCYKIYSQQ